MTILKLAIDASGAKQGAREVEQAVDQVGRSAEKAGKAVDTAAQTVGRSLDSQAEKAKNFAKTVESVGEVTQISQRVRLLGEEVRNLGSGMGSAASIGQTLSGALIDIAQISGKVEGGFGGFLNLLKANPLLVAATVIGGIATAMSLFGDETDDTNNKLKQQIQLQEELRKASLDLATQIQRNADLQAIGFDVNLQEQEFLRARRLSEIASGLKDQGGFQTFADLQALTGLSEAELRSRAGRGGLALSPTERVPSTTPGLFSTVGGAELGGLTNEAARNIILEVARLIRQNAPEARAFGPQPGAGFGEVAPSNLFPTVGGRGYDAAIGPQPGPLYGVNAPSNMFPTVGDLQGYGSPIGPQAGPGYMSPDQLAAYQMQFKAPGYEMRVNEEQQRARLLAEELDRLNERLQQLKSLGQDVGQAIGGAFFSIVNGAANARQALAALLQQFVAIAQQRAIQGIANSIGNAFGASTQQQINNLGSGNTSVSVPTTTGGGTAGGGLA
jgi:hypothetical protein